MSPVAETALSFEVKLPHLGPSKNELARMHWAAKGRVVRLVRDIVGVMARNEHLPAATGPRTVRLTVIRGVGGGRTMDDDGCATACAPIVDGLRDARLLIQDDPKSARLLTPVQVRDPKGAGLRVRVELWDGIAG